MPKKKNDETQALDTIKKELIENFNKEIKDSLIDEIDEHINKKVSIEIKMN